VVDALFSDDSLKNKRNTQAIEVGPNTLVAARVIDYKPASVRPLDEVKDQVRQLVQQREALRLAREAGEARLAELHKQPSDAGFGAPRTVSRSNPQGTAPNALNAILRAPVDKLPTYVGVELDNEGYLIAQVLATKAPEAPNAEQRQAQLRVLGQQAGAADELTYAEGLKRRHKVEILKPELRREAVKPATPADNKK
jgi:peptidyl-prolyl cis-trans isomerase D